MKILAIDPGSEQSAWLRLVDGKIDDKGIQPNQELRNSLAFLERGNYDIIAIEEIAHYGTGMPAGKSVFDTCKWIGRFAERCPIEPVMVLRKDVKMHFCGSMKAKDGNIRQALLDRFGGKDKAIGRKPHYGPLRGITSHLWSALAIGLFAQDTMSKPKEAPFK